MTDRVRDGSPRRREEDGLAQISLAALFSGDHAHVTNVSGGRGLVQRAAAMGIIPGAELEIVRAGRGGPLIVRVHEGRVVLGRGMAHRILVTRKT